MEEDEGDELQHTYTFIFQFDSPGLEDYHVSMDNGSLWRTIRIACSTVETN